MIAVFQLGNSDNKLTQQDWSRYVNALRSLLQKWSIETHFFASSEGSAPWQNACMIVSVLETDVESMNNAVTKLRRTYKQKSVALVMGDVRMI